MSPSDWSVTAPRSGVKVPRITAYFWIVKILTTAFGEATSDYLVHRFNPYAAVVGGFLVFAVALAIQLAVSRYEVWGYWFAVTMVAVFGTMAADVLHIEFGIPYVASTIFFLVVLAVVFGVWWRVEGTLSIHSVFTFRRELFYWAAVLATFAMGTAAGDLAAYTATLGFLSAGVVFGVAFAAPAVAYRWLGMNAILAFWLSYIFTRPLGASFADWLGKSRVAGGLGYGEGEVAAVLALLILGFTAYLQGTGKDRPETAVDEIGPAAAATFEPILGDDAAG